jgi:hypothetical protein
MFTVQVRSSSTLSVLSGPLLFDSLPVFSEPVLLKSGASQASRRTPQRVARSYVCTRNNTGRRSAWLGSGNQKGCQKVAGASQRSEDLRSASDANSTPARGARIFLPEEPEGLTAIRRWLSAPARHHRPRRYSVCIPQGMPAQKTRPRASV